MSFQIRGKDLVFGGGIIVLIFLIPVLFFGSDIYVTIHDNLDSEVSNLMMLKSSHNLLGLSSNEVVPNVFNGLPRAYFHSEFSFIRVIFYLFPSFTAYEINTVLVRLIGFIGMLLLAKDYFLIEGRRIGVIMIALTFSVLPIYSIYGISVMGQPLLVWSFLNLARYKFKEISIIYILLFPFYSHIAFTGPFVLAAFGFYGVYLLLVKKESFNWVYFLGLVGLMLMYLVANFSMIATMFIGGEVSHRSVWDKTIPSASTSWHYMYLTLKGGQYHSATLYNEAILIFSVLSLFVVKQKKIIVLILLLILGISFLEGYALIVSHFLEHYISVFKTFQVNRFSFFLPLLSIILFMFLLQEKRVHKFLIFGLIGFQFFMVFTRNNEIYYNYIKLIEPTSSKVINIPTFRSYYAEEQFKEIADFIGKPQSAYRVISVGLPPSISQYNGFYTLDSYQNNYPLSYKNKFRKIIKNEIARNLEMKHDFESWGSRCYVKSAELAHSCGYNCTKNYDDVIGNLDINSSAFKSMGGEYIFSSVPINRIGKHEVIAEKVFEDSQSSWIIYLYKI